MTTRREQIEATIFMAFLCGLGAILTFKPSSGYVLGLILALPVYIFAMWLIWSEPVKKEKK